MPPAATARPSRPCRPVFPPRRAAKLDAARSIAYLRAPWLAPYQPVQGYFLLDLRRVADGGGTLRCRYRRSPDRRVGADHRPGSVGRDRRLAGAMRHRRRVPRPPRSFLPSLTPPFRARIPPAAATLNGAAASSFWPRPPSTRVKDPSDAARHLRHRHGRRGHAGAQPGRRAQPAWSPAVWRALTGGTPAWTQLDCWSNFVCLS